MDYTFKRGDLTRIELRTSGPSKLIVAHIHDILYEHSDTEQPSYSLLVTKYTSWSASGLPPQDAGSSELLLGNRELIVHFHNYRKIGAEADAHLVELADIISAEKAPCDRVIHAIELPKGE